MTNLPKYQMQKMVSIIWTSTWSGVDLDKFVVRTLAMRTIFVKHANPNGEPPHGIWQGYICVCIYTHLQDKLSCLHIAGLFTNGPLIAGSNQGLHYRPYIIYQWAPVTIIGWKSVKNCQNRSVKGSKFKKNENRQFIIDNRCKPNDLSLRLLKICFGSGKNIKVW